MFKTQIANSDFEIQQVKESMIKMEKLIETNKEEFQKKIKYVNLAHEEMDGKVTGNSNKIINLDDKFRSYIKNQEMTGGGNYGLNIVEEIEGSI